MSSPQAEGVGAIIPFVAVVPFVSTAGTLHTVFVVVAQAVLTPAPPHVPSASQLEHGAVPDVDQVDPATHGTSHTVSAVFEQAVLTPAGHVASAAHVLHGAFPEAEKVVPATHAYKERRRYKRRRKGCQMGC